MKKRLIDITDEIVKDHDTGFAFTQDFKIKKVQDVYDAERDVLEATLRLEHALKNYKLACEDYELLFDKKYTDNVHVVKTCVDYVSAVANEGN